MYVGCYVWFDEEYIHKSMMRSELNYCLCIYSFDLVGFEGEEFRRVNRGIFHCTALNIGMHYDTAKG